MGDGADSFLRCTISGSTIGLGAGNDTLNMDGAINNGVDTTGVATAQKQTVITLGEGENTHLRRPVGASITAGAVPTPSGLVLVSQSSVTLVLVRTLSVPLVSSLRR